MVVEDENGEGSQVGDQASEGVDELNGRGLYMGVNGSGRYIVVNACPTLCVFFVLCLHFGS